MVLLKGVDDRGFRFFTNYESARAAQLEATPGAALIVVLARARPPGAGPGPVERLGDAESDAYFASRPRESQLGAWASPQSPAARVPRRARRAPRRGRASDSATARSRGPPHWGGYLLRPLAIEFWQGQVGAPSRSLPLQRGDDGWRIERLAALSAGPGSVADAPGELEQLVDARRS